MAGNGMNYMDYYKRWLKEDGKSDHTVANYLKVAETFQEWFIKNTNQSTFDPKSVSILELLDWKKYLLDGATYVKGLDENGLPKPPKRYSIRSVQTFIKVIKTYFDFLYESDVIARNPAQKLKPPKTQKDFDEDPRWLERVEKNRLLNFIEDPDKLLKNEWRATRNKAIIFSGLHGGLRRSEIVNLQLDDLSFENSSFFVRDSKGDKSRWIPMNTDLKKALTEWIKQRGTQDHPYLFVSQKGGKLSSQAVWNLCEITIAPRIFVPDFTPHVLRHTFAHDLIVKGYSLEYVKDLLGHSNINYTIVYTSASKADKSRAVESISEERDEN
jgi:site-specific recombinase XerD